jgi:hypothetical protein
MYFLVTTSSEVIGCLRSNLIWVEKACLPNDFLASNDLINPNLTYLQFTQPLKDRGSPI